MRWNIVIPTSSPLGKNYVVVSASYPNPSPDSPVKREEPLFWGHSFRLRVDTHSWKCVSHSFMTLYPCHFVLRQPVFQLPMFQWLFNKPLLRGGYLSAHVLAPSWSRRESFSGETPSWKNAQRADIRMKWQAPTLLRGVQFYCKKRASASAL